MISNFKYGFSVLLLSAVFSCSAVPPPQTPKANITQGFSEQRLQNIDDVMLKYIEADKLVGTVSLVARNGEIVHFNAHGLRNRESGEKMTTDTIFRIYSMTKPVTAVAALSLWEQGKFHMNDPISKYLPELKNLKVYVSGSGDNMVLEDAQSPVRIIDLFMHTAGFSYGFSNSEVDKLYRASPVGNGTATPDTVLSELAKLPLNHQPGTQWNYGVNTDVIGFLVEKLSGKKLGDYMQETIFEPLGMVDTGFYVKPENHARFAQIYGAGDKGQTVALDSEPLGDYLTDPAIHNAGGGLTSTAKDYLAFAQMLLNGGEYKGKRILGRKTVQYMRSNHLSKDLLPFSKDAQGEGYGLAVSVTVDENQLRFMGSTGDYGWSGAASTYFRIDPKENMVILSMTQFLPIGFHAYHDDFRNVVYQALVDENVEH
ncbi:serine hydrolase domain-containing protein [Glaciecola sp. 2405UD65-10]|uniref:serine hydrolase domain-containing protein n=1 Tax=Glaciecola sp. 2405UD65-10 TaxID=3397244 RepID=UPI003B5A8BE3